MHVGLSRIELRYQRLRLAQKDLREVEQQVNQLRRKEQKAKIELEVLEQETQKLFESEVTMVKSPSHGALHLSYKKYASQL